MKRLVYLTAAILMGTASLSVCPAFGQGLPFGPPRPPASAPYVAPGSAPILPNYRASVPSVVSYHAPASSGPAYRAPLSGSPGNRPPSYSPFSYGLSTLRPPPPPPPPPPRWVPEINDDVTDVAEPVSLATNDTQSGGTGYQTVSTVMYYSPPKSAGELAKEKAEAAKRVFAFRREQADRGSPLYRFLLGQCYLNGEGCETNAVQGLAYIQRAASDGNPDAALFLQTQRPL
jgi:hypothetical protein